MNIITIKICLFTLLIFISIGGIITTIIERVDSHKASWSPPIIIDKNGDIGIGLPKSEVQNAD